METLRVGCSSQYPQGGNQVQAVYPLTYILIYDWCFKVIGVIFEVLWTCFHLTFTGVRKIAQSTHLQRENSECEKIPNYNMSIQKMLNSSIKKIIDKKICWPLFWIIFWLWLYKFYSTLWFIHEWASTFINKYYIISCTRVWAEC